MNINVTDDVIYEFEQNFKLRELLNTWERERKEQLPEYNKSFESDNPDDWKSEPPAVSEKLRGELRSRFSRAVGHLSPRDPLDNMVYDLIWDIYLDICPSDVVRRFGYK